MKKIIFSSFLLLQSTLRATAIPTWPSSIDEIEDIMFLNTGYQARGFSAGVTPCSFSPSGPSRMSSAEWLRTAFHDMATGNVYQGTGGLDASIVYELGGNGGENIGSAFNTTLQTFTPFFSTRAPMSDLIALGVYTSVRACGGPVVTYRAGRVDATTNAPPGVPLPQNSQYTFIQQFDRTGFNVSEMIAVTVCGHTIGGVHAGNFPEAVVPGSVANDYQHLDSTFANFDQKIAVEYLDNNGTDALNDATSLKSGYNSDFKVFTADNNATVSALTNPAYFASTCAAMLQKLIETVPSGVTLTDPVTPYIIKPSNLQLTLQDGGANFKFTGQIRILTSSIPLATISSVTLAYLDRSGATGANYSIATTHAGDAAGFDDTFSVSYLLSSL
jgi:hypothetical protein